MEYLLKQIADKISSYNIFNNLYPGIVFCYLLKFMFNINILSDNWFERLIIFYFTGMGLSRFGSLIIEPLMKKIKIRQKALLWYAPYKDYEIASNSDKLIPILSEVNNTYRTLVACFACAIVVKLLIMINDKFIQLEYNILLEFKDWLILFFFLSLFAISYVKQTGYVRRRVESLFEGNKSHK